MSKRRKTPNKKLRIALLVYMMVILLTLLTVASYTWFSLSRTPRVSDMNMYINAKVGLELSPDPLAEEWTQQLDFRDLVDVTTPLRPITWSDQKQQFFAAVYGLDGRLTDVDTWQPLTDERNANKDNLDGYYIKASLYARTDVDMDVALAPAVEIENGRKSSGTYVIGTPLWDSQNIIHNNGGQGAENAVRIGIRITPVNELGEVTEEPSEFFIYEPNTNLHTEEETSEYINTPSIDGTDHLIDEDHLFRQTASTWTEAYPVQRDVVIRDLGEFDGDTELFSLKANDMVLIDLYVWLEGQDVDCTNRISEAQILASIQFVGDAAGQSGLKPIE